MNAPFFYTHNCPFLVMKRQRELERRQRQIARRELVEDVVTLAVICVLIVGWFVVTP